jgi:hypothetical protein
MSEAVPDREWEMRRYRPGDEHALLALFNSEFGLTRSLAHWNWQFRDNPYGGPYMILAERRDDRMLVGSHVLMPFPLNVRGRRLLAGHTLDLVVHHDYRRQGIFEITARACFEWLVDDGGVAVVAFPNASSYPGFVRSLGWHRIVFPNAWSLRLGTRGVRGGPLARVAGAMADVPLRAWSRLTRRRPPVGAGIRITATAPDDADGLWDRIRSREVFSLWKDRRYLAWRYDANPDHRFEYVGLERSGSLDGLAVVTTLGSRLTICELLAGDGSPRTMTALLTAIETAALERGLDAVEFIGHDSGVFADALAGYRCRLAQENVFCGRSLVDDPVLTERFALPGNWTLSYGDADFV